MGQHCFHMQDKKYKQIVLLHRLNTLAFKTIFQSGPPYLNKLRLVPQFTVNYIRQDDFVLRAPCPSTCLWGKPKGRESTPPSHPCSYMERLRRVAEQQIPPSVWNKAGISDRHWNFSTNWQPVLGPICDYTTQYITLWCHSNPGVRYCAVCKCPLLWVLTVRYSLYQPTHFLSYVNKDNLSTATKCISILLFYAPFLFKQNKKVKTSNTAFSPRLKSLMWSVITKCDKVWLML